MADTVRRIEEFRHPPEGDVTLVDHVWPLNRGHHAWLETLATKHGFSGPAAVLRHLISRANAEEPSRKRHIFTVVRCFHCDVSQRAGFIEKEDAMLPIHAYQLQWLEAVKQRCNHPSVEKTVRIIINFYRGLIRKIPDTELIIFGELVHPRAEVPNSVTQAGCGASTDGTDANGVALMSTHSMWHVASGLSAALVMAWLFYRKS